MNKKTITNVGMDRDRILLGVRDLQERFILGNRFALIEQAKTHLHRGFLVRLMILQHAAVTLDVVLTEAIGPLSSYKSIELTMLLNSFYLNLAGSLDNLAWAIAYQHGLRAGLDESKGADRRFVGLLNSEFLNSLINKGLQILVNDLRSFENWYKDLRDFRDPGAHRIPLFVPMAIFSEDVLERTRLDLEAAAHYSKGDHDKGRETMHTMENLGTFRPHFIAEKPGIEIYRVGPRITEDFAKLYEVADKVFARGFDLNKLA